MLDLQAESVLLLGRGEKRGEQPEGPVSQTAPPHLLERCDPPGVHPRVRAHLGPSLPRAFTGKLRARGKGQGGVSA